MLRKKCLLVFTLLAAFSAALAIVPPLDQKSIHGAYKESEFETVAKDLEFYADKYKGKLWIRDDSISLYKHLAVVYTASQGTREKGKYYMIAMLRIMPSAEILDMYVSEEVDRIFLRTRQEFLANMEVFGVGTLNLQTPSILAGAKASHPGKEGADKKSHWAWKATAWTAGGLGLVAAGASTYFLMQENEPTEKVNTIVIPSKSEN